jgi:hypothetical protein
MKEMVITTILAMKNKVLKLTLVTSLLGMASTMMYAQTLPATMKPHGTNSSGVVTALENIDSVTVGGTYQYFVLPDPAINVGYNPAVNLLTNLVDTFLWSTKGASTITRVLSGATPVPDYVNVAWNGAVGSLDSVIVYEKSMPAGCLANSPTKIPVRLIHQPQAYFTSIAGSICSSNPTTVSIVYPFTLATDVADGFIRVHVKIVSPLGSTLLDSDLSLNKTSATTYTFNNTSAEYGTYTATITVVSDRISRKSFGGTATGIVGNAGSNIVYSYTINRTPNTGVIYHIPNQ